MSAAFVNEALYRPEPNPLFLGFILGAAFLLGVIHVLGPGHGKSLMAAYLVGTLGRVREAIVLALAITFS